MGNLTHEILTSWSRHLADHPWVYVHMTMLDLTVITERLILLEAIKRSAPETPHIHLVAMTDGDQTHRKVNLTLQIR